MPTADPESFHLERALEQSAAARMQYGLYLRSARSLWDELVLLEVERDPGRASRASQALAPFY
jgi:hypothetical protein